MQRPTIPDAAIQDTDPETLIYCFTPWIQKVANRYRNAIKKTGASLDTDDLFQVGCLALLRAQEDYDPAGGASFFHFSFYYLRTAMQKEIRKNRPGLPLSEFVFLDEPIADDPDHTKGEIVEDPTIEPAPDRAERLERAAEVHKAVDRLKSENKRNIVNKVWFEDMDIRQAAAVLGMKPGAAYAAHKEALSKLRRDHALQSLCAPTFAPGVSRFRLHWESCVEAEVIWRDEHSRGGTHDQY